MNSPLKDKRSPDYLSESALLIGANLVAAVGNYFFQAVMRRHLSWSEFGYLNATLSLILFAGVPLTSASQTLTHQLARIRAAGDEEHLAQLQAASLKLLRFFTWILFGLGVVLMEPIARYLHFPRMGLAWAGLLWLPVNLWSTLGGAWCTGLSRFRLLAGLMILTAAVRCLVGTLAVIFYPWAEAGVSASIAAGMVLASVAAFSPHHAAVASVRQLLLHRDWLRYGTAALAVSFAAFAFLQGDQIIAQRHFSGDELGRYSGAGLLGRTVVWVALPVLTVYFTRRSGHHPQAASPTRLLGIYLVMIFGAAFAIDLFRHFLLRSFLGTQDADLAAMTAHFALAMIPIGILQAMGCHVLAARRFPECFLLGVFGVGYLLALSWLGSTPERMLSSMEMISATALIVLGLFAWVRVRRDIALVPK